MNTRFLQIVFVFSLLLLINGKVDGQSKRVPAGLAKYKNFQIPGKVKLDSGDPSGTIVNLINLDSKQTEKSINVPSTGKFDLELSYFKEYKITVTKEGYYDKELRVSTVIPRNVWEKDSVFPPFSIIVSLYKKIEDANKMNFEGKTIGKIYYSPNGKLDNFDSEVFIDDQAIQDEMNNALKSIIDKKFNLKIAEALEYEKKQDLVNAYRVYGEALKIKPGDKFVIEKLKELAAELKDLEKEAKNKAESDRLIALGDANVVSLKYSEAVLNYKGALKIIPDNPVAESKLAAAEKLLAQAIEKAKQDAEFARLIAEGDANVKQAKYTEGIANFKAALVIRPKDPVAVSKLAEAEKLLAQAIEKAKQDAEFARLIAEGDANVKLAKYTEGIANFKAALVIRPKDPVAVSKLAEAEKLLAQAIEKAKQDAEFARLIAEGDANVKQAKYTEGIANFKAALMIHPKDQVAETKLAEAEKLLAQAIEKAKQDAEFARLIAEGDQNVKQTKYEEGITSYKSALKIRPGDATTLAKIAEAEKLLAQAIEKAKQDTEFARLIAEGDANVKQAKYTEGIANFKAALVIRPKDPVAVSKLAEAEKLLAQAIEKAKQDAEFARLLTEGDANVKLAKYTEGIANFKAALVIRPKDPVAVSKLAEAEKLLAQAIEKAKQDAEFARLIAEGDANVKQAKYTEGIANFKAALVIRPKDQVAETKLAEAEKLLAQAIEKAKQDAEFARLIAEGDQNVKQTKYEEGITSYKSALKIRPGDATTLAKIAEAEKLLAQAIEKAKQDAEFTRLIAEGDANVKQSKYTEGIANFKAALVIRPKDPVAVSKLAEAEKLLAQAIEKAKQDAEFARLIAEGDANVKQAKYAEGIANFKAALVIRPKDPVAVSKLAEAEKLLAQAIEKAKQDAEFARLIAEGDANVKQAKYTEGIANFKAALVIRPKDQVAETKLAEAEKLLAQAIEKAKQDAEFARLIAEGDQNVKQTKYEEGITSYKSALKIRPGDATTLAKIAEAEKLLAQAIEKAKQDAEFARLIAEGDANVKQTKYTEGIANFKAALVIRPKDPVAVSKLAEAEKLLAQAIEKAKQDAEFARLLAEGDANVKQAKYAEGIANFKAALVIRPKDPVAVSKLAEAEKLLAQAIEKAKQDAEFARLIAEGDVNVKQAKYTEGIANFKAALVIRPKDQVAETKLAEAEKLLAQAIEKAKQDAEFARLIAEGDQNVKQTKYEEGITSYKSALRIRPGDATTLAKIAEAEKLLAQAIEKAKQDAEFTRLIAEGDANVKQTKYTEGIANFKAALVIRPKDPVAVSKLAEAEKLLAQAIEKAKQDAEFARLLAEGDANVKQAKYTEGIANFKAALVIRPKDPVAVSKLAEAEKLLAQAIEKAKQDAEFARLLTEGDANVKQAKYTEGIANFKAALVIRPKDQVAESKLAEAEKLLAQAIEKAKQDAEFARLIAEGDQNVKQTKYEEGITSYKSALKIRPGDATTLAKIAEAEKLLAQAIEKAKQDAEFARLIAEGDANVKQTKYTEGIANFKAALVIRPKDPVAVSKLAEAEKLLAQAIEKAKQDAEFARLLAEGDANVKQAKYTEGIANFKAALVIRPKDPVAVSKLAEAEKLLAQAIEKAKQDAEFARLIAEGDANVKQAKYTEGIANFKAALMIHPKDQVAETKLAEAEKLLAQAIEKAKQDAEFARLIAEGDQNVKQTKYEEGITSYKSALKIRPGDATTLAKIAEAEKLLAQAIEKAKQDAEFARLIAEGDANVKQSKFNEGIANFKAALVIRPKDPVAVSKLAEAEKLLAQAIEKAKQDAEFARLIAEGDANVKLAKYTEGIANFKAALVIRPKDPVAVSKLAEAEKLLAQAIEKAKQDAEFARLIAEGDANVKQAKYTEGIANFKAALVIRPKDQVAETKLAEAEKLLAQAIEKAKQDAEFARLIAEGDQNVKQTKYEEGITSYKSALKIRPGDATTLAKIAEAEKLLAQAIEKAKQDAEFARLIAEGDANVKQTKYTEGIANFKAALVIRPKDPVAVSKLAEAEKLLAQAIEKAKQDAEFARLLAEGDANVKQAKYAEGIANFKAALVIRPKDPVAVSKLAEAEKLLAQAIEKAKQDAEFARLLAEGDANVKQAKYTEGIANFKAALVIRPKDQVAESKLAEAEKLLAQSMEKAKQDAEFNRLVAEGDANVKQTKYTEGISSYKSALSIKPGDAGVLAKIAEAEKLLAQTMEKAKQDAEFNRLVAEGDANVKQTKYTEGISSYKSSLSIKPGDAGVLAKISEVEKLLAQSMEKAKKDAEFNRLVAEGDANVKQTKYTEGIASYQSALSIKPGDAGVLAKIAEAEKLLAQTMEKAKQDAEFNRLVAEGDANVKQTKYTEGISSYKSALSIKPGDAGVLAKIAEAEKLLAQSMEKAKKDAEFNRLVAEGDEQVKQTKYTEGIASYKSALSIKPGDAGVLAKIAEAEKLLAQSMEKAKQDAEFNRLVAEGDANVKQTKYTEGISSYKSALSIKPGDAEVLAKIAEAEKLLAQSMEKAKQDAEFNRLVAEGDANVKQTKYPEGISSYKSALSIKPGDAGVLAKIAEAEKLLAQSMEKAKQDAEFNRLVAEGDANVKQTKYPEGISSYKSALSIKPGDAGVLAKIAEAEKLLAQSMEKAKKDAEFNRLVAEGDANVKQTKYSEGIASYKSALSIKPGDAGVLAKIAEAEKLLAQSMEKAKKDAEFNRLVAEGDEQVKQTKYPEGISSYKSALSIKPGDAGVLAKIAEAEKLLAQSMEKAKKDAEFNRLVAEGDANVKQTKYSEGIASYKSALSIKPGDAGVLAKIAEAEKLLAQSMEKAKKDAEFNRLVAEGDEQVKQTKYSEGIASYKSALSIKPGDAGVLAKIAEAEKLLAQSMEKAKKDAEFNRLVAEGDANVKQTKYSEGIASYKSALSIKPGDAGVLAKIAEAEKLLAQSMEKAKKDAEFNRLVAEGDEQVKQTKYSEGIASYKSALSIKPGDAGVLAKIAEAEKLLAQSMEKAKKDAEFNRLVAEGDANVKQTKYTEGISSYKSALSIKPGDAGVLAKIAEAEKLLAQSMEKAKKDAEFNRLVAEGDEQVKQTKYTEGISSYKSALSIKPGDTGVLAKIAETEKLLAQSMEKSKKDAEFNRLVAEGDANVKQTKYTEGIASYKSALAIKPGDAGVLAKIAEAEKLLAQLMEKAKKDAEFNRLVAEGDEQVKQTKYTEGIASYKSALAIKPGDAGVLAKIAEAEKLLAQSMEKSKKDAEFNRLVAEGDEQVKQTKYTEGIASYKSALSIKPGDAGVLAKIAEAEKLLAQSMEKAKNDAEFNRLVAEGDEQVKQTKYSEGIASYKSALSIKPGDAGVLAKIAEAEKLLAQSMEKSKKDAEFNRLVAEGDANVKQTKYTEGISSYKSALSIKPGDAGVLAKIAEAENLLAQSMEKAKKDAEFNRLVAEGDANVKQTKYSEGIASYKSALSIKPGDAGVLAKIAEAEKLLAQSMEKAKKDAEFNRLVAEGDEQVKQTKYSEGIASYKSALSIKPGDAGVLAKIAEAEKLLAQSMEKAKKDAEFNRLVAEGDANVKQTKYTEGISSYKSALSIKPGDAGVLAKIAEAEKLLAQSMEKAKKDAEFNRLVAEGDEQVKQTKYTEGISSYKSALSIKPGDTGVLAKIAEAEKLLAQSMEKSKKDAEFNRLVAEGDEQVKQTKYTEGISSYKSALSIKPGDAGVLAKIAEAEKLLAQSMEKSKKDAEFIRLIAQGNQYVKQIQYVEGINSYKAALSIRPGDAMTLTKIAEAEKLLSIELENAKQKLYLEAINRGESYFAIQQYSSAIAAYSEAHKIKPAEMLPPEKIREIQAILDALAAKVQMQQTPSNENKLSPAEKLLFEKTRLGDENFKKAQWTIARFYYIEGLNLKQDDKYLLSKIEACDKMIESEITAEKMQEFKGKIANADDQMKARNYSSARFYYRSALDMMNWDSYPLQQLKQIDKLITEQLSLSDQKAFEENLKKADEAFIHKEYPGARFYYEKAKEISETDHIKYRIKEIESILNGFEAKKTNATYENYIKFGDEALNQKNNPVARFYYLKASILKPDEGYPKERIKKIDSGIVNP